MLYMQLLGRVGGALPQPLVAPRPIEVRDIREQDAL